MPSPPAQDDGASGCDAPSCARAPAREVEGPASCDALPRRPDFLQRAAVSCAYCASPAASRRRSARRAGRRTARCRDRRRRARSQVSPCVATDRRPCGPGRARTRLDFDIAQSCLHEIGHEDVGHSDGVVDRRTVPAVGVAVIDAEELDQLRDEDADGPVTRRRSAIAGVSSAWCVTSSPITVTSIPA